MPVSIDRAGGVPTVRAMITLTNRAADRVRAMLADAGTPDRHLRVLVESGGCSGFQYGMSFDEPKPDDATCSSAKASRILLDPSSLAYLNGSRVDFDDGLQGKGFEIQNPNAQSTCGCGKSFS
jgi:iron-sulfur cluster assembly accessory protein